MSRVCRVPRGYREYVPEHDLIDLPASYEHNINIDQYYNIRTIQIKLLEALDIDKYIKNN